MRFSRRNLCPICDKNRRFNRLARDHAKKWVWTNLGWVCMRCVKNLPKRKRFCVTHDEQDAPDGAVVGGYKRCGDSWEPVRIEILDAPAET